MSVATMLGFVSCIHKPTSITHVVSGSFLSAVSRDVALIRGNSLEFYSLEQSELVLHKSALIYGRVSGLFNFRPSVQLAAKRKKGSADPKDWVVVALENGEVYICGFFNGKLVKTSLFKDQHAVRSRSFHDARFASDGSYLLVNSQPGYVIVAFTPKNLRSIISQLDQGSVPDSSSLIFEDPKQIDLSFMHVTDITSLSSDTQELLMITSNDGQLLSQFKVRRSKLELVKEQSLSGEYDMLLPLSSRYLTNHIPAALLIGNGLISYWTGTDGIKEALKTSIMNIQCYVDIVHSSTNNQGIAQFLLGTVSGKFHIVSVNNRTGAIVTFDIEHRLSAPNRIVHVSKNIYFIASNMGESILVRLLKTNSATNEINSMWALEVVDTIDNLCPLTSFCAELDENRNIDIITCSGGLPLGSIKKLQHGYDLNVLATAGESNGITGCWTATSAGKMYWVMTTPFDTQILVVDDNGALEQLDRTDHLRLDGPSVLAFSFQDIVYQVTTSEVVSTQSQGPLYIAENQITTAVFNAARSQLILGISGKKLISISLIDPTQTLEIELDSDATALTTDTEGNIWVGLWQVKVIKLDSILLKEIGEQPLGVSDGKPTLVTSLAFAGGYLYVGTADGYVICFHSSKPPRKLFLGKKPVDLFSTGSLDRVVAVSTSSYILVEDEMKRLNSEPIVALAPLDKPFSARFGSGSALLNVTSTKLSLIEIAEEQQLLMMQTSLSGVFRRVIRTGNRLVVLRLIYDPVAVDQVPFTQIIPSKTCVELVTSDTLKVLDSCTLHDYELGECLSWLESNSNELLVGTSSYIETASQMKSSGRVIRYSIKGDKLKLIQSLDFSEGGIYDIAYLPSTKKAIVACGQFAIELAYSGSSLTKGKRLHSSSRAITCIATNENSDAVVYVDNNQQVFVTWAEGKGEARFRSQFNIDGLVSDAVMLSSPSKEEPEREIVVLVAAGRKIVEFRQRNYEGDSYNRVLYVSGHIAFDENVNKLDIIKLANYVCEGPVVVVSTSSGGLYLYGHFGDEDIAESLKDLQSGILTNDTNVLDMNPGDILAPLLYERAIDMKNMVDFRVLERYVKMRPADQQTMMSGGSDEMRNTFSKMAQNVGESSITKYAKLIIGRFGQLELLEGKK